jgi:hypothetical protein
MGLAFHHHGVAGILLQMSKIDQVEAGAIEEKADHLFEHLGHGLTFAAFTQLRKARGDLLQPPHVSEKPIHQAQAGTAAQGVLRGLDFIDNRVAFNADCGILAHLHSYPLGLFCDWIVIGFAPITYHSPPNSGWDFFGRDRSS